MANVKDADHGYRDLLKRMKEANAKLFVGITEKAGSVGAKGSEGLTVADIATFNEFGTDRTPERSFLRGWFDENEAKSKVMASRMMQSVVAGKRTTRQALEVLGLAFVGGIQQRISKRIDPENAASTIAKKGSDVPLIDTGQLRSAITYVVIQDGAVVAEGKSGE